MALDDNEISLIEPFSLIVDINIYEKKDLSVSLDFYQVEIEFAK
jgi:hypothetical protein